MLTPVLTPHGVLTLRRCDDGPTLEPARGSRLEKAFAKGSGHGLLCLGADEVGTVLPPVLSYWREFGGSYVTTLCALPGIGEGRVKPPVPAPPNGELEQMVFAAPLHGIEKGQRVSTGRRRIPGPREEKGGEQAIPFKPRDHYKLGAV
jgi:hypothetical protein